MSATGQERPQRKANQKVPSSFDVLFSLADLEAAAILGHGRLIKKLEEHPMLRKLLIGAVASAAMMVSTSAFAQGTAAEAKAMLDKAVAAVKADKAKAIASFNDGTGGFKDRDLYPFCFNISDGVTQAAPPSVRGKDVRTLKDATGKAFGEDLYKAVQDGKVNEVNYMFPKPGATEPSSKVSFVTKVGDLGCGVGYYK